MATLVISPVYEYGNFKSSNSPTHKGQSLQGRKSPVSSNPRRNSTNSHTSKAVSPPHNAIRQSDMLLPTSPKTNNAESRSKLERAMSEPADKRMQQSPNSSRYKTELCRPFEESGTCKYGDKCQFAHGVKELRTLARHPKYKTELCRSFHTTGLCPYGPRCHFIHNNESAKVGLFTSFPSGVGASPTLPPGRPKALSSSSLGSSGDVSPPSSHSGSPTVMKTSENRFQFPSPTSTSVFSFRPHEYSSSLQRGSFPDYNTREFNQDFYDTSNIFPERMLSSVFGSLDSGLDLEASSICGSPTLELFPPPTPMSPSSPLFISSFPVFNFFGKQDLN